MLEKSCGTEQKGTRPWLFFSSKTAHYQWYQGRCMLEGRLKRCVLPGVSALLELPQDGFLDALRDKALQGECRCSLRCPLMRLRA